MHRGIYLWVIVFVSLASSLAAKAQLIGYYGGPVIRSIEIVPIFIGEQWYSDETLIEEQSQIETFLEFLVSSEFMYGLYEYGAGPGICWSGINYPSGFAAVVTDNNIQATLGDLRYNGEIPAGARVAYFIFLPPGVELATSDSQELAYHSGFFYGAYLAYLDPFDYGSDWEFDPMNYAAVSQIPIPELPMARSTFDDLTAYTSHELSEICTDPYIWAGEPGWIQPSLGNRGEVADVVSPDATFFGGYLVSEYYSDRDHGAIDSPTPIPTATRLTFSKLRFRHGAPATLSLRVVPRYKSLNALSGYIYVYDGSELIDTVEVLPSDLPALQRISLSNLAPGAHQITASYSGNGYFFPSPATTATVHVLPAVQ